ncbi:hypothetical protein EE612_019236, partial [Oryza sativa]
SGLGGELVAGDERAVEAVRHAGRQLHGGLKAHVGGIDDEELGGPGALVVDEGQDVAVVLAAGRGGGGVHGDEAGLAAEPALAVLELGELTRGEVHLGEARHLGPRLGHGEVGAVVGLVEDGVGGGHARADHHHLVGVRLLPRVPEVEAEAVRDVHPHHLRRVRGVLGSTPNRDVFSLSSTTGEPPRSISWSLNTTWWSGTTT